MAGEGEEVGPLLLCVRFHLLLRVGVVGPCVVLLVVAAAAKAGDAAEAEAEAEVEGDISTTYSNVMRLYFPGT